MLQIPRKTPLQAAANNKNTPCKPLPVAAAEAEMKMHLAEVYFILVYVVR